MDIARTQDAYALLVEECRNKQINRFILTPETEKTKGPVFKPHDPQVNLSDVPVFYHDLNRPSEVEIDSTLASLADGTFRLPYNRCAFIAYLDKSSPVMIARPDGKMMGRHFVVLATEIEDDGDDYSFEITGFIRHDDFKHWSQQIWQCHIAGEVFTWAFDTQGSDEAFKSTMITSTAARIMCWLCMVYKMNTQHGSFVQATGSRTSEKIDKRRSWLDLDPVPRIRVLNFDLEPDMPMPRLQGTGPGARRSPHHRRGHWRKGTIWVRQCKVHGGGDVPPWYQLQSEQA